MPSVTELAETRRGQESIEIGRLVLNMTVLFHFHETERHPLPGRTRQQVEAKQKARIS
ncbi:hypothetical protein [Chromobacterium amazonense]|uniref:hypothetical protein n=1 Tax=Chromobacterium amazonense TaxID=1382803 RepID=UPI0031F64932